MRENKDTSHCKLWERLTSITKQNKAELSEWKWSIGLWWWEGVGKEMTLLRTLYLSGFLSCLLSLVSPQNPESVDKAYFIDEDPRRLNDLPLKWPVFKSGPNWGLVDSVLSCVLLAFPPSSYLIRKDFYKHFSIYAVFFHVRCCLIFIIILMK